MLQPRIFRLSHPATLSVAEGSKMIRQAQHHMAGKCPKWRENRKPLPLTRTTVPTIIVHRFTRPTQPQPEDGRAMLSNLLSNSMKHGALDRFSPISARRFHNSVWEIFRVDTHNTNGRRLFRGIQLVTETTQAGAAGADGVQE